MSDDDWITVPEVARRLQRTRAQVYRYIEGDLLPTRRDGPRILVSAQAVARFVFPSNRPERFNGEHVRGEEHGIAKLSEAKVRRLRQLSALGVTGNELARIFEVSPATISHVLAGKVWGHVK